MKVRIEERGTSPLLMHNIQLADPDNRFVQDIATFTGKRKKTEDDRRAIEKLEWYGGLYADEDGPVMPTAAMRRCIEQAGIISKQKTAVRRALAFGDLSVPLVYDGPRDLDALWKLPEFRNRAMVGIQGKRTVRVRPQFREWALVADAELLTDVLDLDDFRRIVSLAGRAEGLGDNRVNGYGRFTAVVTEL